MRKFRIREKLSRGVVLGILFVVLFLILLLRLFRLQIVEGESYAEDFRLQIRKEIPVKGTRGTIYDRNGTPLARDQLVYCVTFQDVEEDSDSRTRQLALNGKLWRISGIIRENGDTVEDSLQIMADRNGNFQFTVEGTALDRFRADVFGRARIEEMTEEEKNAGAQEIVDHLADRFCVFGEDGKAYTEEERREYGLPEAFENGELLELLGMRYALSLHSYQKYLPVTMAENVSEETAAAIMENQAELAGADVQEDSIRVYEGGEACASILGYTGAASVEELEELGMDGSEETVVGKAGLEQYLDSTLRGENGEQAVYVDNLGQITEDLGVLEKPRTGKDVYLSIDVRLQNAVFDALEKKIAEILTENLIDAKTFDVENVNDTTEIRIPVYDAYTALLTNGAVDLGKMQEGDASGVEKEVALIFKERKAEVIRELGDVLYASEPYEEYGEEMQAYQRFMTENTEVLLRDKMDEESEPVKAWYKGTSSLREYLMGMIDEGWIDIQALDTGKEYLGTEETYALVREYILQEMEQDTDLDEIIYRYLLLDGRITPEQVFEVLYEQGKLDKEDGEYEQWRLGGMSTYGLLIDKIKSLEITPADLALDPCSGSAVVTDTETGNVLACVSYPGYDNNRLANRMDGEYYYQLMNNDSLPLYNRATQQLCAPGSTFKPVTVIAGLQEGVIDPSTEVFCDGVFDKVSPALRCWNHAGHGAVSGVGSALMNSCNDYLCEISYRLGTKEDGTFSDDQALGYIQKYAELFDLDQTSGIELTESSPQITDRYGIPSAIGQGTNNFSTVQLGRYVTTLANEGISFQLSLIDRIGEARKEPETESRINLPAEVWDNVHAGMEQYAQSTGSFDALGEAAAGKSGTAQESAKRPDHALFVGYAPDQDPEIAVAVRIVNGYAAGASVECASSIFNEYFTLASDRSS